MGLLPEAAAADAPPAAGGTALRGGQDSKRRGVRRLLRGVGQRPRRVEAAALLPSESRLRTLADFAVPLRSPGRPVTRSTRRWFRPSPVSRPLCRVLLLFAPDSARAGGDVALDVLHILLL